MNKLNVRITFDEECLGTNPGDPDVFKKYIGSKSPNALTIDKEVEALGVAAVVQKQMTIFPRIHKKPFIYGYQLKGFFKAACQACAAMPKTKSKELKAYKKKIDTLIHVIPREMIMTLPKGKELGVCQRPLRASTPQGERVALAMSESAPPGTYIDATIVDLTGNMSAVIKEWLDYGEWFGLLQWRNSGKGRFHWRSSK